MISEMEYTYSIEREWPGKQFQYPASKNTRSTAEMLVFFKNFILVSIINYIKNHIANSRNEKSVHKNIINKLSIEYNRNNSNFCKEINDTISKIINIQYFLSDGDFEFEDKNSTEIKLKYKQNEISDVEVQINDNNSKKVSDTEFKVQQLEEEDNTDSCEDTNVENEQSVKLWLKFPLNSKTDAVKVDKKRMVVVDQDIFLFVLNSLKSEAKMFQTNEKNSLRDKDNVCNFRELEDGHIKLNDGLSNINVLKNVNVESNDDINNVSGLENIHIKSQTLLHVYMLHQHRNHPQTVSGVPWNRLNEERLRLLTFAHYPHNASKSAILLAAQGFVYIGKGRGSDDSVICHFCCVMKQDWRYTDDVSEVHAHLSPDCPLVSGIQCNNIPMIVPVNGETLFAQLSISREGCYSERPMHKSGPPRNPHEIDVDCPVVQKDPGSNVSATSFNSIQHNGPAHVTRNYQMGNHSVMGSSVLSSSARQAGESALLPAQPTRSHGAPSLSTSAPTTSIFSNSSVHGTLVSTPPQGSLVNPSEVGSSGSGFIHTAMPMAATGTQSHSPTHRMQGSTASLASTQTAMAAGLGSKDPASASLSGTSSQSGAREPTKHATSQNKASVPSSSISNQSTLPGPGNASSSSNQNASGPASSSSNQNTAPGSASSTSNQNTRPGSASSTSNQSTSQHEATASDRPNTNKTPTYGELGIITERPKRYEYAVRSTRYATFDPWPESHPLKKDDLADAGFYYAGYGDCARCFYCGGGLRNWENDDNVWVEHARWFPKCAYIRQTVGQQFINAVQMLNRSFDKISYKMVIDKMGAAVTSLQQGSKESVLKKDPAVLPILDMGYSEKDVLEAAIHVKETYSILSADKLFEKLQQDGKPRNNTAAQTKTQDVKSNADAVSTEKHIKELKDQNVQLRQQTQCKICMDKEVSVVFLPCGHLVSCTDCAAAMKNCPLCRKPVNGIVRAIIG